MLTMLLLLQAAVPAQAVSPEPAKKICRRIDATESRLGARRVCKTAEEWRAEQYGAQSDLDRMQRASRNAGH